MLQPKYSNQAVKFLKKLQKDTAKRILKEIEKICEQPFPTDVKRIEGYKEKIFRIRVGNFRIMYEINYEKNVIGIIKIDKRDNIYD